jgi:hypothetical protein
MNKEEIVRKKYEKVRKQLDEIESNKEIKENNKLVGKCFKYLNSYSSPSEKWWLYKKIIKGDKNLKSMEFEHTALDIYEVKMNHWTHSNSLFNHIEISSEEFNLAWLEFKKSLIESGDKYGIK